ncbi:hypothetical protein AAMO2058_000684500 [Amorphochlora amoebiformis]
MPVSPEEKRTIKMIQEQTKDRSCLLSLSLSPSLPLSLLSPSLSLSLYVANVASQSSYTDSESVDDNISLPRDPCGKKLTEERTDIIAYRPRHRAKERAYN